jgi:hypothetical protein
MRFIKLHALVCALFLCASSIGVAARGGQTGTTVMPQINWIAANELKERFDRKEEVAILDVRSTDSYVGSDAKIKGAFHMRLRRLNSRLAFAPLKDIPRDREDVT